jgi:DNA-binding LytR/AlgR family response regulator
LLKLKNLKPFSHARFSKACNKAQEQQLLRSNITADLKEAKPLFIKSGYEQIRVEVNDILYVESCGNYVQFVLANSKVASRLTMSEAATILPPADFIRIHRSYMVAKKQIKKMDKKSIWINQTELPIGLAYIEEIEKIGK